MTPLVFLDFDGVLNTPAYRFSSQSRTSIIHPHDAHELLDPDLVGRLQRVCDETGAAVVFHTSWRHHATFEELKGYIERRGFKGTCLGVVAKVIDVGGPSYYGGRTSQREAVIFDWLRRRFPDASKLPPFVAFDDMATDREFPTRLGGQLVATDPDMGLTDADVERAVALLTDPGWHDSKRAWTDGIGHLEVATW